MRFTRSMRQALAYVMMSLLTLAGVSSVQANSAMVGTLDVIEQSQASVDRAELKAMLATDEVKDKLMSLGVSPEQVEQRIDSLTADELAHFNAALESEPAGGDVLGIIVLFLVIFIVTDMLCATDIFPFVKCINR